MTNRIHERFLAKRRELLLLQVTEECDPRHTFVKHFVLLFRKTVREESVMALYFSPLTLQNILEQKGERLFKRKGEVLFRRGEEGFSMFVVLSGKVSLDFSVDSALARCYGPGALLGLPATLTRQPYRMTATIMEDTELSMWSFSELDILLRKRRDFSQQMLAILGEKMAESQVLAKALAYKDRQPSERSRVA